MTKQEKEQFERDVFCAAIQGQLANPNSDLRPQHQGQLHHAAVVADAAMIAEKAVQVLCSCGQKRPTDG